MGLWGYWLTLHQEIAGVTASSWGPVGYPLATVLPLQLTKVSSLRCLVLIADSPSIGIASALRCAFDTKIANGRAGGMWYVVVV